jgi:RNA polymerase sigma factor (sigma-70 family)
VVAAFRPLPDHELERLSDDALIAYARAGRGHPSARQALRILVFGHWRNVERAAAMKIPPAHVEDVTADIVESAITSAFDGGSVGEFVSWLKTIRQRRIADFYRRGPGAQPGTVPIGSRDDEVGAAGIEPAAPDETGAVEVQDAVDRVLAKLNDRDRRVVELLVFKGRPAQEAADEIAGMTVANAQQIVSRFRRALRGELDT